MIDKLPSNLASTTRTTNNETGNQNTSILASNNTVRRDRVNLEQQMTESEKALKDADNFNLAMIIAKMKNLDPSDADKSEEQMTNMMYQSENIKQGIKTGAAIREFTQMFKNNLVVQYTDLLGKEIGIDGSKASFDGNKGDVATYQFEVKEPFHGKLTENKPIIAEVIIKNDKNIEVFKETIKAEVGKNTYKWDGRNNTRAKLAHSETLSPAGEYSISIRATGDINVNGHSLSTPLTTSTIDRGIVEQIEIKDGTAHAIVQGRRIATNHILSAQLVQEATTTPSTNVSTTTETTTPPVTSTDTTTAAQETAIVSTT